MPVKPGIPLIQRIKCCGNCAKTLSTALWPSPLSHWFISSFNKYIVNTYCVSGPRDTGEGWARLDTVSAPMGLQPAGKMETSISHFNEVWWGWQSGKMRHQDSLPHLCGQTLCSHSAGFLMDHWKDNSFRWASVQPSPSLLLLLPLQGPICPRTRSCPASFVERFVIHETYKEPSFLCIHKHSKWSQGMVPSNIFDTLETLHSALHLIRRGILSSS